MTLVAAVAPGIHARSEPLVQATRDHDRGRIDDAGLQEARRADVEAVVGTQVAAGFGFVTDGALDVQDLFRPLSAFADGVVAGALTRFRDTNTFYRRPELAAGASLPKERAGAFFAAHYHLPATLPGLLTLPSPLALAAASAGETTPSASAVTGAARGLVRPLVRAAPGRGVRLVVLDDPFAACGDAAAFDALGNAIAEFDAKVPVWYRVPFHDAAALRRPLTTLPVAGIIVDLVDTDVGGLARGGWPSTLGLGLGVVDVRSSLVEAPDALIDAAIGALETFRPPTLILAPDGDLQHVPEATARRKLRVLGEAAAAVAAKAGGAA